MTTHPTKPDEIPQVTRERRSDNGVFFLIQLWVYEKYNQICCRCIYAVNFLTSAQLLPLSWNTISTLALRRRQTNPSRHIRLFLPWEWLNSKHQQPSSGEGRDPRTSFVSFLSLLKSFLSNISACAISCLSHCGKAHSSFLMKTRQCWQATESCSLRRRQLNHLPPPPKYMHFYWYAGSLWWPQER